MGEKNILDIIIPLAEGKYYTNIVDILKEYASADIGEVLSNLDPEHIAPILSLLDEDDAGEILNHIDPDHIPQIFDDLGDDKSSAILDEMYLDDVADILGGLTKEDQDEVLDLMESEDADDVRELMEFPLDTAGGIMTTEYVVINENITTEDAINVLRETAPDAETVYYVYVVDYRNRLSGVISLRELIISKPDTKIADIMLNKVKCVNVYTDQEEVAALVSKYDLLAIPVVDDDNCLVGIITVDDIIDVIQEEATDDILRMGGATAEELEDDFSERIKISLKSRLPWLIITLFGGLIAGTIIRRLEAELQLVVALAYFIPLLTGMGGNVGTQSSTLTVRGIATGQLDPQKILSNVLKESFVGLLVGLVCGIVVTFIAYFWQKNLLLGLIVGGALLGNMTTAATMGTLVPLVLKRLDIDPAVASAPFISTAIDITGLLIYAGLASIFIPML